MGCLFRGWLRTPEQVCVSLLTHVSLILGAVWCVSPDMLRRSPCRTRESKPESQSRTGHRATNLCGRPSDSQVYSFKYTEGLPQFAPQDHVQQTVVGLSCQGVLAELPHTTGLGFQTGHPFEGSWSVSSNSQTSDTYQFPPNQINP